MSLKRRLNAAAALAVVLLAPMSATAAADADKMGHQKAHGAMAAGHDMSVRVSIADGAVLTKRPTSVRLDFVPAMRLRSVVLTNAAGERIPVTFEAKAASASVVVSFAALEPDAYTMAFSADAGDHDMPGRVRFTVV